ncbi:hypothetical protein M2135_002796 [Parabacteroides sp. PF5-9]|nr:hypothetical protein [Parabacteroides sp. PF5-9]
MIEDNDKTMESIELMVDVFFQNKQIIFFLSHKNG